MHFVIAPSSYFSDVWYWLMSDVWCRQCRLWRWWQCDACRIGFGTLVQADGQPNPNTENQGIQWKLHMGSSSPVVIRLHSASHGPCICCAQPLHMIWQILQNNEMAWWHRASEIQFCWIIAATILLCCLILLWSYSGSCSCCRCLWQYFEYFDLLVLVTVLLYLIHIWMVCCYMGIFCLCR